MAKTFRCSIVTPVESIFDQEVMYASVPAWDGQVGVMPGMSPLLTRLGYGPVRLDFIEGGSRWYLLEGGFAQVQNATLTLLTDAATPAEKLSLHEAEAELAETNAQIAQSGQDRAAVERDQQRAMAKVTMARAAAQRGGAI